MVSWTLVGGIVASQACIAAHLAAAAAAAVAAAVNDEQEPLTSLCGQSEEEELRCISTSQLQVGVDTHLSNKGALDPWKVEDDNPWLVPIAPFGYGQKPLRPPATRKVEESSGPLGPKHRVVFIQMRKVGGTTFAQILRRRCDNYGLRCAGSDDPTLATLMSEDLQLLGRKHRGAFDIVSQFSVFEPILLDVLAPNSLKVAMFRNPADRVLSSFRASYHLRGASVTSDMIWQLLHGEELKALPPEMCDEATAADQCCGPAGAGGQAMTEQMSLRQIQNLDFVMLSEEYTLSLVMFRRLTHWPLADFFYIRDRSDWQADLPCEFQSYYAEMESFITSKAAHESDDISEVARGFFDRCILGDEAQAYTMAKAAWQDQWNAFSEAEQQALNREAKVFDSAIEELEACCKERPDDIYCRELSETGEENYRRHGWQVAPMPEPYPLWAANVIDPKFASTAPADSAPLCKAKALSVLAENGIN